MRRILIVGCGPASVNVMKSIHEINQNNEDISKRYEVYATDSNKWHLHFMNRFPEIQGLFHITEKNPKQRAKLYKKICDEYGITFIHIQPDSEVWNMSRFCGWQFEDNILGDRVFLPDHNIIDICQNKWETAKRWSKFWEECHQQNMNFPIWVRAISGAGGYGSCLINNNDEFKAYMDFIKTKIDVPMMFQKYLPGRNLSWESLWCNGELIASQGRERLEYIYPNLSISE